MIGIIYGREYSPTLLLLSHMDTSRSTDRQRFSKAQIRDGRLYGVGASDCKSGLAAQIYAGKLLKESCNPLYGNLIVVASVSEHNGCSIGVRHFLKDTLPALGLQPSFAVLGEPTDMGLYYGHDGWVSIEVKLASTEIDALEAATTALLSFLSKGTFPATDTGSSVQETNIHAPEYVTAAGTGYALIRMDQRLRTPQETIVLLRRMKAVANLVCKPLNIRSVSAGIARTTTKTFDEALLPIRLISRPWMTDPLNPIFEEARLALRTAQCTVRGGTWTLSRLGMGTAGSALETAGIPTIGYGPGNEMTAHEPDEFVELDNVREVFFGTTVIAHRITGIISRTIHNN